MSLTAGYKGLGPVQRYLTTNSTQASFSLHSTPAHKVAALTGPDGLTLSSGAHHRVIEINKARGVRLTPFGKGADNATFDYKVWLVEYLVNRSKNQVEAAILRLWATGTATLSSALTPASGSTNLNTNEIRGDGVTITGAGVYTAINTANGGSLSVQAYAPADDINDAVVVIPDIFDADGVLIEMDLTGATEANWLYRLTR